MGQSEGKDAGRDEATAAMTGNVKEAVEIGAALVAATALGYGGLAYASVWPTSRLFGTALTAPLNPGDGLPEIALTFDDGPNPRWTPQLLDVLARREVRATFFLIGKYAATQPELVRRTHDAGHLIGNHTWTHPNLARTSTKQTREELSRTSAALEQITGAAIRYFRPPFGLRRPATFGIARELGLIPVTWTVIGNDWKDISSEAIARRVSGIVSRSERRGYATNIVLHDGSHRGLELDRARSVAAAGQLLDTYMPTHRFVRLDAWGDSIR